MIAEHPANLAEDISFLKRLAGEGRGRPAPMAALVAGFGLLYGLASLYQWWATTRYVAAIRQTQGLYYIAPVWWAAHGLFALLALGCVIQAVRRRSASLAVNRIAAAGWTAAFLGLAGIVAAALLQGQMANNYFALNLFPSFLLVLWGFGWFVSAAATGQNWLYAVALASFAAAPLWAVTAFFSFNGFLVAGFCFLLLAFLPGLILMRRR